MRAKQEFQNFFTREGINKNASFLLAVSGGVDSMVLMELCRELDLNFSVAHCNFRLRGEESDLDQALVVQEAQKSGIPVYSQGFDTADYASENGLSIQMAARELRYGWFKELMIENSLEYLLTAHHKNDNAETLLFNLAKGTGISGLRGIKPATKSTLRPLLGISKEEILEYARENNLKWREDASNEETKYHRNYIRKEIIPLLQNINPSFLDTLDSTLERLQLTEEIWNDFLVQSRKRLIREEKEYWFIEKEELKPHGHVLLYELIRSFGFSMEQCRNMLEESGTGRSFQSGDYEIVEDRGRLLMNRNSTLIEPVQVEEDEQVIEWGALKLEAERKEGGPDDLIRRTDQAQFDLDRLKFPLQIRSWEPGDYFFPLGMKGKKKISDFMIDRKIPLNLKKGVGLLCSGEDVVWIIGYQIDDRFKITEATQKIYQLRISSHV